MERPFHYENSLNKIMSQNKEEKTYVTVKEACFLLGCGRTKIYTYYLKNDLLNVAKKVGNRTLFLKRDVDELVRLEDQQEAREEIQKPLTITLEDGHQGKLLINREPPTPDQSYHNPESGSVGPIEIKSDQPKAPKFYRPPASNINHGENTLVTDYISELKSRIHELEQNLSEKDDILSKLQDKLINSIPKIEYSQKIEFLEEQHKQLEDKLETKSKSLEQSEQTVHELQSQTDRLDQIRIEQDLQNEALSQKFQKSLEIALSFQENMRKQEQELQEIRSVETKLRQAKSELNSCGLFDFSIKRNLKSKIQKLEQQLQKLLNK